MESKIKAVLKPGKEVSVLRGHPWIFSGALASITPCEDGDWCEVFSSKDEYLCSGHVSDGSIAIRVLDREQRIPDVAYWQNKLQAALNTRVLLGLSGNSESNCFRLVHGEGDEMPGLIIDVYADSAVIQAHSSGMFLATETIAAALQKVLPKIAHIYSKSRASLHDESVEDGYVLGGSNECVALEYGLKYRIDYAGGQKTGFFLDQRENRKLLREMSAGKTVLNTFSYTGGFSMAAIQGGAKKAVSVDVSASAVKLADENAALNSFEKKHEGIVADVMQFLREGEELFDIVVLDPPAFAKNMNKKHAATQGYKRLNEMGMKKVKSGGLLFTFSCSQVIDQKLFENTVTAAGIEAGVKAKILYRLGQGPDHPVGLFHPEGHYLKGLVLEIT